MKTVVLRSWLQYDKIKLKLDNENYMNEKYTNEKYANQKKVYESEL